MRNNAAMRNLDDVLAFVSVVNCGSFTAAARELKLSPSVVSRRVSALEQTLGVQLVRRTTRHISLSNPGKEFFERCNPAIHALEDAQRTTMLGSDAMTGMIRVRSTLGLGQRLLAAAVGAFARQHPGICVELDVNPAHRDLVDGEVDVVISQTPIGQRSTCKAFLLADMKYVLCAAPEYLEMAGMPRVPGELAEHNCLIHELERPVSEWRFRCDGVTTRVRVRGGLISNSGVALHEAAVAGLGIARLPNYAVSGDIAAGRLVRLFGEVIGLDRALIALVPQEKRRSTKVVALLTFLRRFVQVEVGRHDETVAASSPAPERPAGRSSEPILADGELN